MCLSLWVSHSNVFIHKTFFMNVWHMSSGVVMLELKYLEWSTTERRPTTRVMWSCIIYNIRSQRVNYWQLVSCLFSYLPLWMFELVRICYSLRLSRSAMTLNLYLFCLFSCYRIILALAWRKWKNFLRIIENDWNQMWKWLNHKVLRKVKF